MGPRLAKASEGALRGELTILPKRSAGLARSWPSYDGRQVNRVTFIEFPDSRSIWRFVALLQSALSSGRAHVAGRHGGVPQSGVVMGLEAQTNRTEVDALWCLHRVD